MTSAKYWEDVALIEERNPGEVLLPSLQRGHTRVNEAYLAAALKRLPAEAPVEDEPDEEETPGRPIDDTLRALWSQRTALFGEMNKASNKFHECKTDDQRAENSRRVLGIWSEILKKKAEISHYEEHGQLPVGADAADDLPDNPVLLGKKLNSLRSMISQRKKLIVDLAGLDESTEEKQAKIDAAEDELKRLRYLAGIADQKLKQYEQSA